MSDDAYSPGTPEVEIEKLVGQPVRVNDERGKMGHVLLTNDRILFSQKKFDVSQGGLLGYAAASALNKRAEKKAGGPAEVAVLADVQSAQPVKKRFMAGAWELTMADGSTCRLAARTGKKLDPVIRRLLTERHGRTVTETGENAWQVS